MNSREIIKKLKARAKPANIAGMARFGIRPQAEVLGVSVPFLRQLAKQIGKNHSLAGELWNSGIHEVKILASMVEEPKLVSAKQMDNWIKKFDSWDICDQTCMNLFYSQKDVFKKCFKWAGKKSEFERRAGFALMACLAVKDKRAADKNFIKFLPVIKKYATDERNYVRKAVNWALRQIGKRNLALNREAIKTAKEILSFGQRKNSKAAKWIAVDALRELQGAALNRMVRGAAAQRGLKVKKRT